MSRASWIRTEALGPLERRVARMARKAERLGVAAPELRIIGQDEERTHVELAGDPPRLSGWRVQAELHHSAGKTEVELLGDRLPASGWDPADPRCDHCGLRRVRKRTLLLEHDSGDVAQVGTGCLADFTGSADPLGAIALERDLAAARAGASVSQSEAEPSVADFLAAVISSARERGFVSKADASEERASTAEVAAEMISARAREPSGAELAAGASLEEWVLHDLAAREDLGGYERRLVSVFRRSERVGPRDRAMIASAWLVRSREMKRSFLGAVGEMVSVEVVVKGTTVLEKPSRHGAVTLHRMADAEGRRVSWFAVGRELEVGGHYQLRGKVRRHERFQGEAVTVLERCRTTRMG